MQPHTQAGHPGDLRFLRWPGVHAPTGHVGMASRRSEPCRPTRARVRVHTTEPSGLWEQPRGPRKWPFSGSAQATPRECCWPWCWPVHRAPGGSHLTVHPAAMFEPAPVGVPWVTPPSRSPALVLFQPGCCQLPPSFVHGRLTGGGRVCAGFCPSVGGCGVGVRAQPGGAEEACLSPVRARGSRPQSTRKFVSGTPGWWPCAVVQVVR